MTYAITGSTGHLGSLVIDHLISGGTAPSSIVAIARSREKAAPLADRGVEVRIADYDQPDTLGPALSGIDRLLLISGSDPGRRAAQHRAVIDAAVRQTVGFLAYTSITRADTSNHVLAPDHKTTEELIRRSGIPSAMLRNNWYAENFAQDVEAARSTGVIEAAAGDGKIGTTKRGIGPAYEDKIGRRADRVRAALRVRRGGGAGAAGDRPRERGVRACRPCVGLPRPRRGGVRRSRQDGRVPRSESRNTTGLTPGGWCGRADRRVCRRPRRIHSGGRTGHRTRRPGNAHRTRAARASRGDGVGRQRVANG